MKYLYKVKVVPVLN